MTILTWVLAGVGVLVLWHMVTSVGKAWDDEGRLKVGTLRALLWAHRARGRLARNPVAVMDSALALAGRIRLAERLWEFCQDCLPSEGAVSGAPVEELTSAGLQGPENTRVKYCLKYGFSASGKQYAFYAHKDVAPGWSTDYMDKPGWLFSAVKVYVLELPKTVALEALVVYTSGDVKAYSHDHIESFRPGEWVVELLKVVDRARVESEARRMAWWAECQADQAKKFS